MRVSYVKSASLLIHSAKHGLDAVGWDEHERVRIVMRGAFDQGFTRYGIPASTL